MPQPTQPTCFGRSDETRKIENVFHEWLAAPKEACWFGILGISGSGGIGKTYLLNSVLQDFSLETRDVFPVQLDGKNKALLADFAGVVDEKLAPKTIRFKGAKANYDYFPETRKYITEFRKLTTRIEREIDRLASEQNLDKAVVEIAKLIYRFGPEIAKKIPHESTEAIIVALGFCEKHGLEKKIIPATKTLQALPVFQSNKFSKLRLSKSSKLSSELLSTFATAYEADIRSHLQGYRTNQILKFVHARSKQVNRMLLVVDDYESTRIPLGELLETHLLPAFSQAPYPVLVVIGGRDDIGVIDGQAFSKDLKHFVKDRIQLEPFTEEKGIQFLHDAGYENHEAESLYQKSNGFPFVLSLLADFKSSQGERPAVFYKQFFERTTQWMTPQQKEWLKQICYLENVDESSIQKMIPEVDAPTVMQWFSNEASVRDSKSRKFQVSPYIRQMLLQHHENTIGKDEYNKLVKRGLMACEATSLQIE